MLENDKTLKTKSVTIVVFVLFDITSDAYFPFTESMPKKKEIVHGSEYGMSDWEFQTSSIL